MSSWTRSADSANELQRHDTSPLATRMLVDVLNERGYRTTATVEMREVPTRIDPATYDIVLTQKPRYHFEVHFQGSQIRRGN